jgi:hypothetical protein
MRVHHHDRESDVPAVPAHHRAGGAGRPAPGAARLLGRQRSAGNAAVGRLLAVQRAPASADIADAETNRNHLRSQTLPGLTADMRTANHMVRVPAAYAGSAVDIKATGANGNWNVVITQTHP